MIVCYIIIISGNHNPCKFFNLSYVIAKIRDVAKISEVISKKVRLSKKGKNFSGLCPFHREKTPSFSVNDDKHCYYCFGCGERGTAIDFVQKTQNLSFVEAVKALAREYNIKIDQKSTQKAKREFSEKEKILKNKRTRGSVVTQKFVYSAKHRRVGLLETTIR